MSHRRRVPRPKGALPSPLLACLSIAPDGILTCHRPHLHPGAHRPTRLGPLWVGGLDGVPARWEPRSTPHDPDLNDRPRPIRGL